MEKKVRIAASILFVLILSLLVAGIIPLDIQEVSAAITITSCGTDIIDEFDNPPAVLATWSAGDVMIAVYSGDAAPAALDYQKESGGDFFTFATDADVYANNSGQAYVGIFSRVMTVDDEPGFNVRVGTGDGSAEVMTLYKITGLDSSPLDQTNSNTGSGTDASTNTSGLLSQNDEVVIAASAVEDEIDDSHGTWTSGTGYVSGNEQFNATNGGGDASNMQGHSVAKIVTDGTSQAYQGVDAGHDNTDWAACIASYKMASVTPDISNSPSSKNFSNVNESSSYYFKGTAPNNPVQSGDCYFSCTNNSGFTVDLYIQGTNWTGGSGWTLTSGSPGSNQARETFYCVGDNPASGVVLTTSPQLFYEDLADTASIGWDGKLETGTFGDGTTRDQTLTISAQVP